MIKLHIYSPFIEDYFYLHEHVTVEGKEGTIVNIGRGFSKEICITIRFPRHRKLYFPRNFNKIQKLVK